VPRYAVQLRFASDADCAATVERLRALVPPATVAANDSGARLVFDDVESPVAALVRAQVLLHDACAAGGVAPTTVRRSLTS
jgi:hypothetical protein